MHNSPQSELIVGCLDKKVKNNFYSLKRIILCVFILPYLLFLIGCSSKTYDENPTSARKKLKLSYATQYEVEYLEDGYKHIYIADGTDYVLVPKGKEDNTFGIADPVFIHEPTDSIYLAASSAMDLFLNLGSLDSIKACSTASNDYSIEEARTKIESGEIEYVGKYNAPDYEAILKLGCDLAIESTMITHSPKIKEELTRLGIPVLTERSSYEKNPLGRLEWIKLYGVILGKEKEAEEFFEVEEEKVLQVTEALKEAGLGDGSETTVAFFYISSNGYVNVRKPGDYVSSMIEMAGGRYAYEDIADESDNALSTMNINWEEFYKNTVDADILIYNATIDGGISTTKELTAKNALFADFKAVKEGNVYCSNADMFQKTGLVADIITDMYRVINDKETDDLRFMYKVDD